jgi:hypothetical protein
LEEYGAWDFKLSKPDKDGVSEREHLEQVEKQIGITPIALEAPPFPLDMEYVWSAFLSLNEGRGAGFSGPLPISYQEIKSWMELTGNILTPFEIDAVKRLDRVYIKVVND